MATKRVDPASAIRQLDRRFMSAAASKDAKTLANAFYAADAVLMPPNAPLVKGRAAIQKFFQGLLDAGAAGVTLKTTKIEADGRLAYGRGTYSFSRPGPDGNLTRDIGKYVVVYRRQKDGGWRAIADIFNSDQPA
jgi:uncharacterized protein (TIGR02246 family)